jgi:hypothetical protein
MVANISFWYQINLIPCSISKIWLHILLDKINAYNSNCVYLISFPREESSIALAETDIIETLRNKKKSKISKTSYWRLLE